MATFLVTCEILIGSYRFTRANEIVVTSSWKELADTATIKLPYLKGKIEHGGENESLADRIKSGDFVTIYMGYIGLNNTYKYEEFKGFVRSVSPQIPLLIECEDATYILRRCNIEKSWRATTLKEVVTYLINVANENNPYEKITLSDKIPDIKFDKFEVSNINAAAALEEIKEKFGLSIYFRGFELFAGVAYTEPEGFVKLSLTGNVISNGLTYKKEEDSIIQIKAIAILPDNKQITVTVGPKSGELVTKFYYDVSDKTTLERVATAELKKLRYEGFEGTVESFLVPQIKHSMTAEINDPEFNKVKGNYLVDTVVTKFDMSGIRRTSTIGIQL